MIDVWKTLSCQVCVSGHDEASVAVWYEQAWFVKVQKVKLQHFFRRLFQVFFI